MRNTLFVFVMLAAGCGKSAPPQPEPGAADTSAVASAGPSPVEEAQNTFKTLCATCHGESGTGNGPASASLNPKPRNYTDKTWQASVTDEQIKQTIVMGGAAVGKSPAMPAQPQLREKPEVVAAMVDIIRGFGR